MTGASAKAQSEKTGDRAWLHEAIMIASVLGMTLAAYLGTLRYGFVYDDDAQIVANSYIQYWRHIPLYFISHVWAFKVPQAGVGNYYRPIFMVWLRLNDVWFGIHPAGWHATAIALHLVATFLVYVVARKLAKRISVAGFTALIFGLHPMHAEAVAWISGATESLCAIFILAGFWAYLKSREGNGAMWMTLSCLLYAFAVFSKETGAVLPLLVFAYSWIYWEGAAESQNTMQRLWACVRSVLAYVPVALFYLLARGLVLHGMGHTLVQLKLREVIFSVPSMLGFYVKKWFLPYRLNEFYDMPYWSTLNFWHVIMPAIVVIALLLVIWMARIALGVREVKFALFWIIVPLLPVLDASVLPRDELVHERYFYLPSFGAALLVGLALDRWTRSPRGGKVFGFPVAQIAVGLLLAAGLGTLAARESQIWYSDFTLYQRGYALAPHNTNARTDFGAELVKRGDFNDARVVLKKILADDPTDTTARLNLSRIDYMEHNYAESERWLNEAIALNKYDADLYTSLALTDLRLNRAGDALSNMREAAALRPNDPTILYAYGVVLELNGNCALASDQFRSLLAIRPGEGYVEMQLNHCQQVLSRTSRN